MSDEAATTSRGPVLATVLVVLIGAIVLAGPLLDPSDPAERAVPNNTPAPTVTAPAAPAAPSTPPVAVRAPTPAPTPLAVPPPGDRTTTPAAGTGARTPPADPTPTAEPASPGRYAIYELIDGVIIARDRDLWTSTDGSAWTRAPAAPVEWARSCPVAVDTELAVAGTTTDGKNVVTRFDPHRGEWGAVQDVEAPPLSGVFSTDGVSFCSGGTVDGRLVFATVDEHDIVLAIERSDGGFMRRSVSMPDAWSEATDVASWTTSILVVRAGPDGVLAAVCTHLEGGCLTTWVLMSVDVVAEDGPAEMTFDEAGGRVLLPSDGADVDVYAEFGGSTTRDFAVQPVGDEFWRVELAEQLGTVRGPDFSIAIGRWAAGPLGVDPVPLPQGWKPTLFPAGGTVVASVPLHPPTAFDEDLLDLPDSWWTFDRGENQWVALEQAPLAPLDDAVPGVELTFAGLADNGTPQVISLDGRIAGTHVEPRLIAGERIYGTNNRSPISHWVSDDRGATWTPLGGRLRGDFCAAVGPDGSALLVLDHAPTEVLVATSTGHDVLGWPSPLSTFGRTTGMRPCHPLWFDGSWWLGHVDPPMLRLHATSDGPATPALTRNVELALAEMGSASGGGTVDVHRDGDLVIVRLCGIGGGTCAPAAAIVADGDEVLGPHGVAPEYVDGGWHQVGDELWIVQDDGNGQMRIGRYGTDLEAVQAVGADVRLFRGQVMRCLWPTGDTTTPECATLDSDGEWTPLLGNLAVDWATVPADTPVSLWDVTEEGTILVVPS